MTVPKKNPPRWFIPSLFAIMFLVVVLLAALAAATHEPAGENTGAGDRTRAAGPGEAPSADP